MIEADFLADVREIAEQHHVLMLHIPDSRKVSKEWKGFPDCFFIGKKRIMFRELKMPYIKPQGEQVTFRYKLKAAGQDADTWYPQDLASGRISQEISDLNV